MRFELGWKSVLRLHRRCCQGYQSQQLPNLIQEGTVEGLNAGDAKRRRGARGGRDTEEVTREGKEREEKKQGLK